MDKVGHSHDALLRDAPEIELNPIRTVSVVVDSEEEGTRGPRAATVYYCYFETLNLLFALFFSCLSVRGYEVGCDCEGTVCACQALLVCVLGE